MQGSVHPSQCIAHLQAIAGCGSGSSLFCTMFLYHAFGQDVLRATKSLAFLSESSGCCCAGCCPRNMPPPGQGRPAALQKHRHLMVRLGETQGLLRITASSSCRRQHVLKCKQPEHKASVKPLTPKGLYQHRGMLL